MHRQFLKDTASLALTAFGGPQAHIAMMLDLFVEKRKYLTTEELIEYNALCQFLPGPTSTQTLVSVAYKIGGPSLAAMALAIWILPAVIIMSALSFGIFYLQQNQIDLSFLKLVYPTAVGFIVYAAIKMSSKTVKDLNTILIFAFSIGLSLMIRNPWFLPVILLLGGIISNFSKQETEMVDRIIQKPKWIFLILFFAIFAGSFLAVRLTDNKLVDVFETMYRFGSLIFGGGQVLIPFMVEELVMQKEWITTDEFLTGWAMVQAVPGPVFSFSAFAGGLSMRENGTTLQLAGNALSAIGIFLPGLLLIFFVYPVWQNIKRYEVIQKALKGINAAASGLVVTAAVVVFQTLGFSWMNLAVIIAVTMILYFSKVPSPAVVAMALILGFIF
ncbi:MAG: chromate efflux transporter [Chitinophagales bacterium]|nr:chromate efflux transporter [Chitinophagales bacterium]